jgi:Fic-DOC domain mobile mystery protein B
MSEQPIWTPIPGETPLENFDGLRIRSVRTRAQLNIVEAENVKQAIAKYLTTKTAPFDYAWVVRLHGEMFGDVWKWAGSSRQEDLNFGCAWHQIPEQLKQLLDSVHSWTDFGWPLEEQAAALHHRAVSIHPFKNGNGRWARLLANLWLLRNGEPFVAWPDDLLGEESTIRAEYIAALKRADVSDLAPLRSLQARFRERSGRS